LYLPWGFPGRGWCGCGLCGCGLFSCGLFGFSPLRSNLCRPGLEGLVKSVVILFYGLDYPLNAVQEILRGLNGVGVSEAEDDVEHRTKSKMAARARTCEWLRLLLGCLDHFENVISNLDLYKRDGRGGVLTEPGEKRSEALAL